MATEFQNIFITLGGDPVPLKAFISELHALEFSDHLGPLILYPEPQANKCALVAVQGLVFRT